MMQFFFLFGFVQSLVLVLIGASLLYVRSTLTENSCWGVRQEPDNRPNESNENHARAIALAWFCL